MDFLSDDWLAAMDEAARGVVVAAGVVVDQVVHDVPGAGTVRFRLVLAPGGSRVEATGATGAPTGPDEPDLRLTTDYATAAAIARGDCNAQEALSRGRLRLGGTLHAWGERGDALIAIGDVFAAVRSRTVYR